MFQSLAQGETGYDRLLGSLQYEAFVNDQAGILSTNDRQALEKKLSDFNVSTGNELVLVLIPSLQGGQIDDFACRLFAKWALGSKGRDNGLLLLAAIQDRTLRIEVGYGLEGVLPDAACGRIRDEVIVPAFREGQYAAGLNNGVDALIGRISGMAQESPVQPGEVRQISGGTAAAFVAGMIAVFVILIVLGRKYGKRSGVSQNQEAISSASASKPHGSSSSSGSPGRTGGGGRSGGGGASGGW